MNYKQSLYKIVEPIRLNTIKRLNKSKKWKYGYNKENDIAVAFETNRGCPYHCAFCDWGGVSRSKITKLKDAAVKETIEHVLEELEAYANLVSVGSYCIVYDTIIEIMPKNFSFDHPSQIYMHKYFYILLFLIEEVAHQLL